LLLANDQGEFLGFLEREHQGDEAAHGDHAAEEEEDVEGGHLGFLEANV
jgi:hypothetical protein